jgi:dUTP pyrophosphatase
MISFEPQVKIISDFAKVPEYQSQGAAAMDLCAAIETPVIIQPGETKKIGTGLQIWIDNAHICGVILPRSGLSTKHGIVLGNTVGLVDSDYQGEWIISMHNRSDKAYRIEPGERIAQAMFLPVIRADLNIVDRFSSETGRGEGGFGSTGR